MGYQKNNLFGFSLDDLGKAVEKMVDDSGLQEMFTNANTVSLPALNVKEYPLYLQLDLAAPGMKKEDFELSVDLGVLSIESKKEATEEQNDVVQLLKKEFNYSSFKRTFELNSRFDIGGITAVYEQGILCITIPKKTEEEATKIKVEIK